MIEKEVITRNKIQSRVASSLVRKAMSFQSNIVIAHNGKKADAKSLINVIALNVPNGGTIAITASGNDEVSAVAELVILVASL